MLASPSGGQGRRVVMNFFYDLPDDIIEHIYKFEHSLNLKNVLCEIKDCRNPDFDTYIYKLFFKSDMSNKEVQDWYTFCLWANIVINEKNTNFTEEVIDEADYPDSKYISHYIDFWNNTMNWYDHYVPGDYI